MITKVQDCLARINQSDIDDLSDIVKKSSQVILIGNGGSNAIASHIAVDYVKFLNVKSFAFSDSSMLTAYMNDYSVEDAYKQFIVDMHEPGGLVILISSSGNSQNIYNAASYCKENDINFIILTGFNINNKIRRDFAEYAYLEYWVDSNSYGVVECVHQIFLHAIVNN